MKYGRPTKNAKQTQVSARVNISWCRQGEERWILVFSPGLSERKGGLGGRCGWPMNNNMPALRIQTHGPLPSDGGR